MTIPGLGGESGVKEGEKRRGSGGAARWKSRSSYKDGGVGNKNVKENEPYIRTGLHDSLTYRIRVFESFLLPFWSSSSCRTLIETDEKLNWISQKTNFYKNGGEKKLMVYRVLSVSRINRHPRDLPSVKSVNIGRLDLWLPLVQCTLVEVQRTRTCLFRQTLSGYLTVRLDKTEGRS